LRLFLAVNLPDETRRAAWEAISPLRDAAPTAAWVAPARIHLTLKFLDEQPDECAAEVGVALDAIVGRHRVFDVNLGGVGAFPNFRRPRVLWMGVSPEPRLELLHHDVEVACEQLGLPLEGRAFRPHLTLARARDRKDAEALRGLTRAAKGVSFEAETRVESVDVMRSVLGATPRYECVHSARLRA
jgi:2'-5' RNA ligase